jgi:hypothetical protein
MVQFFIDKMLNNYVFVRKRYKLKETSAIRFFYVDLGCWSELKLTKPSILSRSERAIDHIGTETRPKLLKGCSEEYWTMGEILIQQYC